MDEPNLEPFDANAFIDRLVEEMGMQNEDPVKLAGLKSAMMEAFGRHIFRAAADNIEERVIDVVMEELEGEEDVEFILQELVRTSPAAQFAMLEAIDEFEKNTLEAFNKLKI